MTNCTHCGERIFVDEGTHITFDGLRFCCEECLNEHERFTASVNWLDMYAGTSDLEVMAEVTATEEEDSPF